MVAQAASSLTGTHCKAYLTYAGWSRGCQRVSCPLLCVLQVLGMEGGVRSKAFLEAEEMLEGSMNERNRMALSPVSLS